MKNLNCTKILLVEDDSAFGSALFRVLKQSFGRIQVRMTATAEEGMEFLDKETFDLIVADYTLAGPGTGLDLWTKCCRPGKNARTPFVMISGLAVESYLEVASRCASAPLFLPKPFSVNEFRSLIEQNKLIA